jgi:hypothetical protein
MIVVLGDPWYVLGLSVCLLRYWKSRSPKYVYAHTPSFQYNDCSTFCVLLPSGTKLPPHESLILSLNFIKHAPGKGLVNISAILSSVHVP